MTSLYVHAVTGGLVVRACQLSSYTDSRLCLSWFMGLGAILAVPRWFPEAWVSLALLLACFSERVIGSDFEEAFVSEVADAALVKLSR